MSHIGPHPSPAEPHDSPWYRKAFEAGYLDLYAHRDETDAARAVDFIASKVRLGSEVRLLDLCCGPGRHLAPLAPRVGSAVGLDLSRALLTSARASCSDKLRNADGGADHRVALVESDMRLLPFRAGAFSVVVNLFTSLGYFEHERDNLGVLEEVARVLGPGGTLIIDHINRPHLQKSLRPMTERHLRNGIRVMERRTFDPMGGRVIKHVRWIDPGGAATEWNESVRVYECVELREMLKTAGLDPVASFGDFDGAPLAPDSPRMILLATRDFSGESVQPKEV